MFGRGFDSLQFHRYAGTGSAGPVPVFVRAVAGRRSVPAGSRGLSHCRFIRQNGLRVFPCLLPAGPAGRLSFFSFFCRRFGRRDSFGTARSEGGRLRVSSLHAVIFYRSVVFRKGRFMRSFPFPDRYRIGPGIFGMRSVSPVPSCSCSVACLVRSFCGSGGDEVASACADSSRLGMFSGYRLYTFLYRPSSSRCFGFPVSSFLRLCGLGQRPDRMRGLWLPTVAGRCKSSGCECAWHMEDNRFFTFGKSSLMLGPRAPHCFSTRPEKSAGRSAACPYPEKMRAGCPDVQAGAWCRSASGCRFLRSAP